MKITLSKSQWEMIGNKAGWMKKANLNDRDVNKHENSGYVDYEAGREPAYNDVEIEEVFINKHPDLAIYYHGENNEGASGQMRSNVRQIVKFLEHYLSEFAKNRFLHANLDKPDQEIANNVMAILTPLGVFDM